MAIINGIHQMAPSEVQAVRVWENREGV